MPESGDHNSDNSNDENYAKALKRFLTPKPVPRKGILRVLGRYKDESPQKWRKIGREVYSRKTLLMASADDLSAPKWGHKHPWRLAATDVFVEKAQRRLTYRAHGFIVGGIFSTLIALICSAVAITFAYNASVASYFGRLPVNGYTSVLVGLKLSAIGGFAGGMIVFFAALAKAMFHEGTALYHRRHALRFGRLYVYLKDGEIVFSELEAAFDWNKDFETAFRSMRISGLTGPFEKMTDAFVKLTDTLKKNDISERVDKKKKNQNRDDNSA